MELLRNLDSLSPAHRGGAVTIGNFDGVHHGHVRILERLVAQAAEAQGPAVVFTFDPHPVRLLRPDQAPPPLTWTDRKAELIAALGVDVLVAYPTDEALLQRTPRDFFIEIVRDRLGARAIVEGENFRFGRDRAGSIDDLRSLASEADVDLEIVSPVVWEGEVVSSSRIRRLVAEGQVDKVRQMLTEPYRLRGMVTHGAGRGASIGFPTANLEAIDTILPGDGVYAGRGRVAGAAWPAAINIGANPTFGQSERKVEIHLIDAAPTLYGKPLEVDFFSRLRDIHPFETVDDLKSQLAQDVEATLLLNQGLKLQQGM